MRIGPVEAEVRVAFSYDCAMVSEGRIGSVAIERVNEGW